MYLNLLADPVRRKSKEIVNLLRKNLGVMWRLKMMKVNLYLLMPYYLHVVIQFSHLKVSSFKLLAAHVDSWDDMHVSCGSGLSSNLKSPFSGNSR